MGPSSARAFREPHTMWDPPPPPGGWRFQEVANEMKELLDFSSPHLPSFPLLIRRASVFVYFIQTPFQVRKI